MVVQSSCALHPAAADFSLAPAVPSPLNRRSRLAANIADQRFMSMTSVTSLRTVKNNTKSKVEAEISRTGGLLRLAPNWVPRSFLQPGLRLKLHPDDTYAY